MGMTSADSLGLLERRLLNFIARTKAQHTELVTYRAFMQRDSQQQVFCRILTHCCAIIYTAALYRH